MWLDDTDSLQKISKKSRQPSKKNQEPVYGKYEEKWLHVLTW